MSSSHVPCDIVTQILLKVPIKTLLRFKSVSKQWLALISNPHFQSIRHRKIVVSSTDYDALYRVVNVSIFMNYSRDASVVYHVDSCRGCNLPNELRFLKSYIKMLGPHHGVYLVHDYHGNAALWNHATKAIAVLSEGNSSELITYGFGSEYMDDGRVDFVVVRFWVEGSDEYRRVWELYRSSIGTWKRLNSLPVEFKLNACLHWTVHINGVLYWLVLTAAAPFLISFDFRTETFGKLDTPDLPILDRWRPLLLSCYTCDETKFLCFMLFRAEDNEMLLWIMKQHSWVKEAVISYKDLHYDKSTKLRSYPEADVWRNVRIYEESLYHPLHAQEVL